MFVYFLESAGDPPMIKIGRSRNVHDRITGLQTGTGHKLSLLRAVRYPDDHQALMAEKEAHKLLKEHRIRGEWFAKAPELEVFMNGLVDAPEAKKPKRRPPGTTPISIPQQRMFIRPPVPVEKTRLIPIATPDDPEADRNDLSKPFPIEYAGRWYTAVHA
jgi:hypothetical protein